MWSERLRPRTIGIILFGAVLALDLATLAPSIQPGDGPELTVAARVLGIPHPSGYPLYVSIGRLFSLFPFGSIALRMNLFAAVAGAAAVGVFGAWLFRITRSLPAAIAAAALLALSPSFWRESTSAEVYSLSLLFLVLLLFLLPEGRSPGRVLLAGYLAGLALTNHLSLVFVLPAFAASALVRARPSIRLVLAAALLFLAGLSLYAFLPVRASLSPVWNWGSPSSMERFLRHVSGAGYWGYFGGSAFGSRLAAWAAALGSELTPLAWIAIPAGFFAMARARRDLLLPVGGGAALSLAYALGYGIHDPEAYYLPAHFLLLVPVAFLVARLGKRGGWAAAAAVLVLAGARAPSNAPGDRGFLDEHVANLLATVEKGGALVVEGDGETFGLLYGTVIEGGRPDISLWNPVLDLLPAGAVLQRFAPPAGRRSPGWKGAALGEAVRAGVPVYAATEDDEVRPGDAYRLEPWGILYRYVRRETKDVSAERETLWARYRTGAIDRVSERSGYLARILAASYPLQKGRELALEGKTEEARSFFEQALRTGGADLAPVLNNAALAYRTIGDVDRARELLARAELRSGDGLATLNLARMEREEGRLPEAVARFERVSRIDRRLRFTANLECGAALLENGSPEEALEQFRLASEERPWEAGPLLGLGESRLAMGDTEGARIEYRKADDRRPGTAILGELGIGAREEERGDLSAAAETYRGILARDPRNGEALERLAVREASAGRAASADSLIGRALASGGDTAEVANRIAWALAEERISLDRALALAREARRLEPGDASYADTEGWVLLRLGRFQEGIASLEEAMRLGLSGAGVLYRLGLGLVWGGREAEGRERLANALALDPSSPYAEEAERSLDARAAPTGAVPPARR